MHFPFAHALSSKTKAVFSVVCLRPECHSEWRDQFFQRFLQLYRKQTAISAKSSWLHTSVCIQYIHPVNMHD